MKKWVIGFVMGVVLMFSIQVSANNEIIAQLADFSFQVNGEQKQLQDQPLVFNGKSYLPVREVATLLDYDVDYEEAAKAIVLTRIPATPVSQTVAADKYRDFGVYSAIIDAVDKAKNAVVGVSNMQRPQWSVDAEVQEYGTGSGVIFQVNGDKAYIITNHHVVEGAHELAVSLPNGDRVSARLVGSDDLTDLAVLETKAADLTGTSIATIGDSSTLRQGEPAIAIGNPLGVAFAQTVTVGVISGTNRVLPVTISGATVYEVDVLQTDAAINFGNSGGALVDINGHLIGINSAKIAQDGVEGIGFAIPITNAMPIIKDLMDHGHVVRPYLGITLQDVQALPGQARVSLPVQKGIVVTSVPVGPAATAGLRVHDIIVNIDSEKIDNTVDLRKALFKKNVGDTVTVTYYRGNQLLTVKVVLEKLPN